MREEEPRYLSIRDYVAVIRRGKWLILILVALIAGGAYYRADQQTPIYKAESAVGFQDVSADLSLVGTNVLPQTQPSQRANEAAKTVVSLPFAGFVKAQYNEQLSARALRSKVSASAEIKTTNTVIQVRDGDPRVAAHLANAYAKGLVKQITDDQRKRFKIALTTLQRELKASKKSKLPPATQAATQATTQLTIDRLQALSTFSQPANVQLFADVPGTPVSPRPKRDALLGGLLALALALIILFVRDALDRRLRSASEIRDEVAFPVLGTVSSGGLGSRLFKKDGKWGLAAPDLEAARILRTNLAFLDNKQMPKSVAITSALPEEGKSTTAANLALASVFAGKRTLLVECDLRRPSLAARLGLEPAPGLADSSPAKLHPRTSCSTSSSPSSPVAAYRAPTAPTRPTVATPVPLPFGGSSASPRERVSRCLRRRFRRSASGRS